MLNSKHTYVCLSDKIKMVQMRESGKSNAEIARELKRDPKTIKLWLDRWDNETTTDVKSKSGAKKSLDLQQEADLVIATRQNRYSTAASIKNQLNLQCTDRTIQKYLNRNEIRSHKDPVKPAVTATNRAGRIGFATILSTWTTEKWIRVVFTDESSFYNKRSCSRRVWRYRGLEDEPPERLPGTYSRIRINVWAAISCKKVEFIERLPDTFDSTRYLGVLRAVLPAIKHSIPNVIWMHDNVRLHRTANIEEYFQAIQVQKMKWPPQSPDLNPIENVWGIVSQKLNRLIDEFGEAQTADELFDRVVDCATSIPPETFANLYASLPNRWNQVIQRSGHPTKY